LGYRRALSVPGRGNMAVKVLVIDDSLLVRQQVGRALSAEGFVVEDAADGVEGLAKLAANPDTRLIVCDVNMPKMSGLEFLEELRRRECIVSVVMLTTEGQPELIHRARALGAKAWVLKPFKPDILIAALKKLTAI
jgi:two-component system chemotaxis response regulator CheY